MATEINIGQATDFIITKHTTSSANTEKIGVGRPLGEFIATHKVTGEQKIVIIRTHSLASSIFQSRGLAPYIHTNPRDSRYHKVNFISGHSRNALGAIVSNKKAGKGVKRLFAKGFYNELIISAIEKAFAEMKPFDKSGKVYTVNTTTGDTVNVAIVERTVVASMPKSKFKPEMPTKPEEDINLKLIFLGKMINGRINESRLSSEFEKVLYAEFNPLDEEEKYKKFDELSSEAEKKRLWIKR